MGIKSSLRRALFIWLVAWSCGACAAERWSQFRDEVFESFGSESGLPDQIVTALAEDSQGFLWVGTQGGLVRYDGYRFKRFNAAPAEADGLPDGYIFALAAGRPGEIWIGTNSAGLVRYESASERFTTFAAGAEGLSHARVFSLAEDGGQGIWIGTEDGLDYLDHATGKFAHFRHDPKDEGSLPHNRVRVVRRDPSGTLWVGSSAGLARKRVGETRFERIALPLAPLVVGSLCLDGDGNLWIGTERGAYLLRKGSSNVEQVRDSAPSGLELEHAEVRAIVEARPGHLWLAAANAGIVEVDAATGLTRHIAHDPARPTSLPHDRLWTLLKDRSGLLWVGGVGGLSKHAAGNDAVMSVFGGSGPRAAIADRDVGSVSVVPGSGIWLGLLSNGIDVIDPESKRVSALRPDPAHPETALPDGRVHFAYRMPDGNIYVGTRNGLYRVSATGAVRHVILPPEILEATIVSASPDGEALWLGTTIGLWRMEIADPGHAERIGAESLSDQSIAQILKDGDGSLWIGTRNGLNHLDPGTRANEQILFAKDDPKSLNGHFIDTLLRDSRGRLWVGTLGAGISILEGRDAQGRPRFRRLGLKEGLPHANIDMLLMDRDGGIWASTDRGVAAIDPESLSIRTLGAADGVAMRNFWGHSGAVTDQGEILFGGLGGLTVIIPDRVVPWTYRPPIVATELRVGGRSVPSGERLTIAPDANSFSVEFAALDYSAPERNRYAYRLEGFDKDWVETDASRRLAAYTNLPPGTYTLRLRGSNRNGEWTETGFDLPVAVQPALYQTLWFRGALGVALLAGLIALMRARTARFQRRQKELEDLVRARTVELAEKNRQLELLSTSDRLTGAYNRLFLDQVLDAELARSRRSRVPFSVILLDADHFKSINDVHGHLAGDRVLIDFVKVLSEHKREVDVVGRWGGEEFLIICPYTPETGTGHLAEKLRAAISEHQFPVTGRLTASLGFATLEDEEGIDSLIARADVALYRAKSRGRNRVEAATPWAGAAFGRAG